MRGKALKMKSYCGKCFSGAFWLSNESLKHIIACRVKYDCSSHAEKKKKKLLIEVKRNYVLRTTALQLEAVGH